MLVYNKSTIIYKIISFKTNLYFQKDNLIKVGRYILGILLITIFSLGLIASASAKEGPKNILIVIKDFEMREKKGKVSFTIAEDILK